MGYIPPNENGSPVPKTPAYQPVKMPVRGAPTPPVNRQAPVQMPLRGAGNGNIGKNFLANRNRNRIAMNKAASLAAAARRKLGQ